MPLEWASIRSMARCVLPVLVGPSTAVTPAPRARADRLGWGENEMGITRPDWRRASCITMRRQKRPQLSFGTSLERIAPESLTRGLYDFVHGDIWRAAPSGLQDRVARRGSRGHKPRLNVNTN